MNTIAAPRMPVAPGPWSGALAAPSLGMLSLVALLAFEQLAVATVMPGVAAALGGDDLYAAAFGAAVSAAIVGLAAAGRWCDRAGPRAPLAAGTGLFVAGLLAAALAPSMGVLVAGRVLQGAGGGLVSVALYVVVGRHYPAPLHARMFAAFAAAWVLPAVVGPALAGWMAQHWGWRWVFGAAVLLALPAALLLQRGLAALPDAGRPPVSGGTPPAPLVVAAVVALGAGLLYLGRPGQAGALLGPLAGLALLALAAPRLLPAGSLRARPGLPAVIALRGLLAAAFLTAEVVIPLALARWRGFTPVQAGLVLTLGALGWSAGSWWQSRMAAGTELRRLRLGLAAVTAGIVAMGAVLWPEMPVAAGIAGWVLTGLGIGLAYPTLSVLMLRVAPPAQQGQAASALQLSDALVSAVGLAGVGALLSAWPAEVSRAGCAAGFALAAFLALVGLGVAGRCRADC